MLRLRALHHNDGEFYFGKMVLEFVPKNNFEKLKKKIRKFMSTCCVIETLKSGNLYFQG